MGPCFGHVNAARLLEVGPHGPLFSFFSLAATEKLEPPRNGIKNRALLCFEVPVASGGFAWSRPLAGLLINRSNPTPQGAGGRLPRRDFDVHRSMHAK